MTANAGQCRPTAADEGQCRPTKNRYVLFCNVHFIFYFLITTKPTKAHSSQQRPMQAHDSQRRPTKPTKANTGLGTSAPRPRRTFIGIFFSFTQSSFQSCFLTYVIIIFLGFNDVVNIVVIVYVDSEFLTTIVVRLGPVNTRTPVTKNPWVDGFGFPWVRVRVTKN